MSKLVQNIVRNLSCGVDHKRFIKMHCSWLILGILGVAAGALNVISLATPNWLVNDSNSTGLWEQCILGSCTDLGRGKSLSI